MKVTKEQAAKHREQILAAAAALFRERGFEGIGVAELMGAAGFTHGGFYGHFSSKEELMKETCARVFTEKEEMWIEQLSRSDIGPLDAMTKRYLTKRHRDNPATGCPLASWAVDTSRRPGSLRHAFTAGLRRLVDVLAKKLDGKTADERYHESLTAWSTLVGALVLSRAVDDPELSDDILQAARGKLNSAASG